MDNFYGTLFLLIPFFLMMLIGLPISIWLGSMFGAWRQEVALNALANDGERDSKKQKKKVQMPIARTGMALKVNFWIWILLGLLGITLWGFQNSIESFWGVLAVYLGLGLSAVLIFFRQVRTFLNYVLSIPAYFLGWITNLLLVNPFMWVFALYFLIQKTRVAAFGAAEVGLVLTPILLFSTLGFMVWRAFKITERYITCAKNEFIELNPDEVQKYVKEQA